MPYLKVFYGDIIFDPQYAGLESKVEEIKIGQEIILNDNEFIRDDGFVIKGWLVNDKVYNVGDAIKATNGMKITAIWGQGCSVNLQINTNAGVILKIYKPETVEQVFIDKTEDENYNKLTLELEFNMDYKIIISTFYTSNITLENSDESQATLYSNILTINTAENPSINITLKIFSYLGNNGLIV